MNLPDFLTTDEFGAIRLTGSRVGFSQMMWHYQEGHSVEALQELFPTLSLAHIHKALAFYWDNQHEADEYLKNAETTMEKSWQQSPKLDLTELRQRLNSRKVG